jgi:hypothetical protein
MRIKAHDFRIGVRGLDQSGINLGSAARFDK